MRINWGCDNLYIEKGFIFFYDQLYLLAEMTIMREGKKGREVDVMSTIKPIQATPELSGKDAVKLLNQTNIVPTKKAIKKNNMLHSVLANVRKS